ncbi:MAG TPA: hypothetical protein VK203_27575 [Nostocaceae cyanobacterium]|nr:hypothetical protein [Nostocaceae cyanobacterium]
MLVKLFLEDGTPVDYNLDVPKLPVAIYLKPNFFLHLRYGYYFICDCYIIPQTLVVDVEVSGE